MQSTKTISTQLHVLTKEKNCRCSVVFAYESHFMAVDCKELARKLYDNAIRAYQKEKYERHFGQ
jgi:hypothetical protein